ncbi:hypothetical protein ACFXAZ_25325 [Streptomyces sp. NPDC059477]|uniref:hypothetical protein n=1 Tax=Streptomyces sp. NPDC059477 TaxID=3346847 RepID=UPI0036AAF956
MQHSAVPELAQAHAHTRPIHWLATATALAGVVALSSVAQPDAATAAQPGDRAPSAAPAAAPPSTEGVAFPIDCGPVDAIVVREATGDLDGDDRPETVAVVHCDAAMSTPPDGVYVLTQSTDATTPRLVATLVDPKDRTTVQELALRDGAVQATLLGYSSSDVPTCCPDITEHPTWQWKDGSFLRQESAGARSV